MKRTPRGGKKINYTLYLSPEERDSIKGRAKELDMSDAYYILKLLEMDVKGNLMPHFDVGGGVSQITFTDGAIPDHEHTGTLEEVQEQLLDDDDVEKIRQEVYGHQTAEPANVALAPGETPTAEDIKKAEGAMQDNLADLPPTKEIVLPDEADLQKLQTEQRANQSPGLQRPQMKSVQDVVAEQTGIMNNAVSQQGGNVRNPTLSEAQRRAGGSGGEGWQDKMHQEVDTGERGESQMRKQILENLPPEKKEEG